MPSWTPLDSSSIRKVKYEPDSRTLHVQFTNGSIYSYADVPPEEHTALLEAESPGSHLHNNIKGHYSHKRG